MLTLLALSKPAQIAIFVGTLVVVSIMMILGFFLLNMVRWWIQSVFTGAGVSLGDLIGMYFRKVKASIIVPSKIMAVQAGICLLYTSPSPRD